MTERERKRLFEIVRHEPQIAAWLELSEHETAGRPAGQEERDAEDLGDGSGGRR